jgi:hypothetical protein
MLKAKALLIKLDPQELLKSQVTLETTKKVLHRRKLQPKEVVDFLEAHEVVREDLEDETSKSRTIEC